MIDIDFKINAITEEQQKQIKKYIEMYAGIIFRNVSNPIEKIIITEDLEKELFSLYDTENDKKNRIMLNQEKSVTTTGKNFSYIENGELKFYILLHAFNLTSPERFHDVVPHEMIHSLDDRMYFDKVNQRPYSPNYYPSQDDYYQEYSYLV